MKRYHLRKLAMAGLPATGWMMAAWAALRRKRGTERDEGRGLRRTPMTRRPFRKAWLTGALFAATCMAPAWAQESLPEGQASADGWQFSVAPYIWGVMINGDVTIAGAETSVDTGLVEIIEESDSIFAFLGHFEVMKGNFGAYLDTTYMDVHVDSDIGVFDVDSDLRTLFMDVGAFYRVGEWPLGAQPSGGDGRHLRLDLTAGARYTDLKVDLDLSVGALSTSLDNGKNWIDPIVGGRVIADLTDRLVLVARSDIGGFGAGSDFTWNVIANLGYRFELFGAPAVALGGYRALYQDFEEGSGLNKFAWDIWVHGPIIALNVKF